MSSSSSSNKLSKGSASALLWVITFAVLFETAALHLILHARHPFWAWGLTLSSLSLLPMIWKRLRPRQS